jgi:DNA-directed RNA polymerase specialized sigma24 family protein
MTAEQLYDLARKVWARNSWVWPLLEQEEAEQQCVLRAWQKRGHLAPGRSEFSFFWAVMKHELCAMARIRRYRRMPCVCLEDVADPHVDERRRVLSGRSVVVDHKAWVARGGAERGWVDKRPEAVRLVESGLSGREVATRLGMSESWVCRAVQRHRRLVGTGTCDKG